MKCIALILMASFTFTLKFATGLPTNNLTNAIKNSTGNTEITDVLNVPLDKSLLEKIFSLLLNDALERLISKDVIPPIEGLDNLKPELLDDVAPENSTGKAKRSALEKNFGLEFIPLLRRRRDIGAQDTVNEEENLDTVNEEENQEPEKFYPKYVGPVLYDLEQIQNQINKKNMNMKITDEE